jgi:hypothetical protein
MTPRAVGLVLLIAACGSTEAAGPPRGTHADFRAIQRHEATLATAQARADRHPERCPVLCDAAARACEASGEVCRIAGRLANPDARERCKRAGAQCKELRSTANGRCDCPPGRTGGSP